MFSDIVPDDGGYLCRNVIAHRGASAAAPENTVEAFRLAAALGSDAVELDVRRTARRRAGRPSRRPPGRRCGRSSTCTRRDLPAHVPTLDAALDACDRHVGQRRDQERSERSRLRPDRIDRRRTVAQLLAARRGRSVVDLLVPPRDRRPLPVLAPAIRTAWLVGEVPDDVIAAMVARGHAALHPWVASFDRSHDRRVSRALASRSTRGRATIRSGWRS